MNDYYTFFNRTLLACIFFVLCLKVLGISHVWVCVCIFSREFLSAIVTTCLSLLTTGIKLFFCSFYLNHVFAYFCCKVPRKILVRFASLGRGGGLFLNFSFSTCRTLSFNANHMLTHLTVNLALHSREKLLNFTKIKERK